MVVLFVVSDPFEIEFAKAFHVKMAEQGHRVTTVDVTEVSAVDMTEVQRNFTAQLMRRRIDSGLSKGASTAERLLDLVRSALPSASQADVDSMLLSMIRQDLISHNPKTGKYSRRRK